VASYLSDQWFDEVGATPAAPSSEPATEDLVLQHVVTGGPEGDVCYHVRIAEQVVIIVRGRADDPDVTFAEDYATAAAIAGGALSAPAALLAGRIRVGGDLAALIAHQDRLIVDDLVPAAVRTGTTF